MTLPFPVSALKQHIVILGKTGAGKSSAMRVIVEHVLDENMGLYNSTPVCIVDPKGDWWGLKTSRDGKKPGYPIAIFGGEHADMPLTPRAGTALAEVVVNAPFPCLIDLGGWMIGERSRFFVDFSSRYFKLAKGRRFLFIDEVHNFVPKGKIPDPDTGKMLHWGNRLASEGRGKGITLVAASQRPQKVHNDFLTSMETLVAMRVIHKADRNAYKDWIEGAGDMALGKQVLETVADIKRGSAWVWSPEIKFGPKIIEFPMFSTYDSFKPQEAGAKELAGRADVDLEQVKKQFATFIQEIEQNDPKILRKRITELEAQVRQTPVAATDEPLRLIAAEERGYKKGLEMGQQNSAAHTQHNVKIERDKARDHLSEILGQVDTLRDNVSRKYLAYNADRAPGNKLLTPAAVTEYLQGRERKPPHQAPVNFDMELRTLDVKPRRIPPYVVTKDDERGQELTPIPTGLKAKILAALRWADYMKMAPAPRPMLGALADFTPDKGYGARMLGELKTDGLISYPQPGMVQLTEQGFLVAPEPPEFGCMLDAWRARLTGLHLEVLDTLTSSHPKGETREHLGKIMGKQFEKGYGARVLGELKTMGVIEIPTPGSVRLTKHVMPG